MRAGADEVTGAGPDAGLRLLLGDYKMSKVLMCAALMLISTACFASKQGEEECIYNFHMHSGRLAEIKAKYPNSRYTKDHDGIIVPVADGTATVSYGGCLHFGYEISLRVDGKEPYERKKTFKRAVELVRQFGGIDASKLDSLLLNGKYLETGPGAYLVDYPDVQELSVTWRHDEDGFLALYISLVD